jgi:hypothetical protein
MIMEEYYNNLLLNIDLETQLIKSRIKNLKESLGYFVPENVLEIGIGTNSFFEHLCFRDTWTIVEPNPRFINHLVNLNKVRVYNVKFEDFNAIDYQSYDLIIISSLLHIIENLDLFFLKLQEVINDNTLVYINVPNSNSIHRLLATRMGIIKNTKSFSENDKKYNNKRVFDMLELTNTLEKYFVITHAKKGSYFLKFLANNQLKEMLHAGIIKSDYLDQLHYLDGISDLHVGAEIYLYCRLHKKIVD